MSNNLALPRDVKLAVIGLGYVGLPLALALSSKWKVIGYDISESRVRELQVGVDRTNEVTKGDLQSAELAFTASISDISDCNVFVITVPTPVDSARKPDFDPLLRASEAVGKILRPGSVVIYESTVYPGVTEEVCVPVLERASGLVFNSDFVCGYSPERINPGDSIRNVTNIKKVTSGSTPEAAEFVDSIYASVITAGTHRASSIRVAEAAKVIENTQRDVNIALMNELASIFAKIGVDTHEVLEAASTKWNFIPFVPGLVGGHCIGVDPYYLAHKATMLGHHPELILAARRINDRMAEYLASHLIRVMAKRKTSIVGARVLILGFAFKENCPDLRNTKVVDLALELREATAEVEIYDPWVDASEALREYGVELLSLPPPTGAYDAVVLAVPHHQFIGEEKAIDAESLVKPDGVVLDIKGVLKRSDRVVRI